MTDGATMRLDRFLWFARFAKTRSDAQALAGQGHLRIDGRPVDRPAAPVRAGNVLTFATHRGDVRVIRVLALPPRRGPAPEAQRCYADLAAEAPGAPPAANVSQQAAPD